MTEPTRHIRLLVALGVAAFFFLSSHPQLHFSSFFLSFFPNNLLKNPIFTPPS